MSHQTNYETRVRHLPAFLLLISHLAGIAVGLLTALTVKEPQRRNGDIGEVFRVNMQKILQQMRNLQTTYSVEESMIMSTFAGHAVPIQQHDGQASRGVADFLRPRAPAAVFVGRHP